ncbi:hypothetical protein ACLOJK_023520 [Asimina triloba]
MAREEIKIRKFDKHKHTAGVEALERSCEVWPGKRSFLLTNTMGDPICRVRNSPQYKMLVAELENEVVGVIRGTVKTAAMWVSSSSGNQSAKVGYILGLRVSPLHRRRGIGSSLVRRILEWFDASGVDYAYMATEKDNEASLKLFIHKFGFAEFRMPAILVNPVSKHLVHIPSSVRINKLRAEKAENLYRKFMGGCTEFFPQDIDQVLKNKLSLGTWVAYPSNEAWFDKGLAPTSWAVVSVWNTGEVFKLRVGRPSVGCVLFAKASRWADKMLPCLRIPALPDFFREFGVFFLYGVHGEGPSSGFLLRALCHFVHNMATASRSDCKVIATELGECDQLRHHIPHWQLLSCPEDLWCIKSLMRDEKQNSLEERTRFTPKSRAIFVDPREV